MENKQQLKLCLNEVVLLFLYTVRIGDMCHAYFFYTLFLHSCQWTAKPVQIIAECLAHGTLQVEF